MFANDNKPKNFYSRLFTSCTLLILISTSYSLARRMKDLVVVVFMGAECISAIKMFFVLPSMFVFVYLTQKITINADDNFKNKFRFWLKVPFLFLFLGYAILEFTGNRDIIKSVGIDITPIIKYAPSCLQSLLVTIAIPLKYLMMSILYTATETYSFMHLNGTFWSMMNLYTKKSDAKVMYPIITMAASVSTILSGLIGYIIGYILDTQWVQKINIYNIDYDGMVLSSTLFIVSLCIFLSMFFYLLNLKQLLNIYSGSEEEKKDKKQKVKMTFMQSVKQIANNKIVCCMSICVLCYMFSINVVETIWKKKVFIYFRKLQNNPRGMNDMYNLVQIFIGITSFINSYITTKTLSRSWILTALIPPICVGITGSIFFLNLIFLPTEGKIFGYAALILPVIWGAINNVFSKSTKYTQFDSSKETAILYIPKQLRDGSKNTIDTMCGRLGKSLGGLTQMALMTALVPNHLIMISGQETITPILTLLMLFATTAWISSVVVVSKEIDKITDMEKDQEVKEN
ncbi:ATP/ADP translocase [uncultured bacterium]|nr:ATP/ADP translocase [uncultured bacterium]